MEYGLIGERLGHSYSAEIHRAFGAYDYELVSLPPEKLEAFIRGREYRGLNVTIPYKQAVMPFCDEISGTARKIGSVNTIVRRPDGSLYGDNTDYAGFAAMAARAGISFDGKKVAVLGSGGTSLTARAVAAGAGAAEIVTVSRKGDVTYDDLSKAADSDIVVNTTPVGMYPHNGESPISLERFPRCTGVVDVIYNPLRTALVSEAAERGVACTGGLYMLTAQAARAYALFCGAPLPEDRLEAVYRSLLASVENIVLVGMPGSGKTTVGRILAERLGRTFVDLDAAVEQKAGMTVPEIFARCGEETFRGYEREAAAEYGRQKGLVIAGGGGIVLSAQNRAALRQNGRVYLMERRLDRLETAGRPLSGDLSALREMAARRQPLYALACDTAIDNNAAPETAAERIREDFYEAACH